MEIMFPGSVPLKTREKIADASYFYARELMHWRMVENLKIDVEVSNRFDYQGECINEDDTKRSRYFTIKLRNKRSDLHILHTLAHEMVHVKQHAKNELKKCFVFDGNDNIKLQSYWRDEAWNPSAGEDPYFDCPWEKEAYELEDTLYLKWLDYSAKYLYK